MLPLARQPIHDLARGNDGDALMAADGQQMLAIPGDDQLGARRDGRREVVDRLEAILKT